MRGWLTPEVGEDRVDGWLQQVEARVLEALGDGQPRETTRLTAEVPELTTEVTLGSGRWRQRGPVSSRLLFLMAMEGSIVRGRPLSSWRSSQFRWVATTTWFPDPPAPLEDEAEGRAGLLRRYLAANGPVTRTDVRWWTGWTVKETAAALAEVGAAAVGLDHPADGYVLPDDLQSIEPPAPHVSLLPGLDPTTMGWKERDWYLGPHADRLFDSNGNAGPTVRLDGRVVGGWAIRDDGEVVHRELEDVGREGRGRIAEGAAELGRWLAGIGIAPRFHSPLQRELTA